MINVYIPAKGLWMITSAFRENRRLCGKDVSIPATVTYAQVTIWFHTGEKGENGENGSGDCS
jgi:hypothetical protein